MISAPRDEILLAQSQVSFEAVDDRVRRTEIVEEPDRNSRLALLEAPLDRLLQAVAVDRPSRQLGEQQEAAQAALHQILPIGFILH